MKEENGERISNQSLHEKLHGQRKQRLNYKPHPTIQGECLLTQIESICIHPVKIILFVVSSLLLVGLPVLFAFWFPKMKKKLYYRECDIDQASRFYVLNNDGQPTYPKKEVGTHCFDEDYHREIVFFVNRYLKYVVEGMTVKAAAYDYLPAIKQVRKAGSPGLSEERAGELRKSYGVGTMIIETKSIPKLFVDEIMRPLYIFIILSCLLWLYEDYYYYAGMIFITAVFGIGASLIQTYRLNKKIFTMAYYETKVHILRNQEVTMRSSKEVVPGDIVFMKSPIKIPFDGILLEGSVLANECSITGESVPVVKKSEQHKSISHESDFKNSIIYEGSYLVQINHSRKFATELSCLEPFRAEFGLPVYVTRTNFVTMKGQLIRVISFPIERQNKFESESVKFLMFLFCLSVISYIPLTLKLAQFAEPWDLFVKFLDLVTVTVPPGLPVSMTFGIIYALEKLKKKGIYCISPNKIIMGGMVNMICFDKTGTLTQDFMDFYALVPTGVEEELCLFQEPIHNYGKSLKQILKGSGKETSLLAALDNMATNHTIVRLKGTQENVGDPMEIKVFEFGSFRLEENQIDDHEILENFTSDWGHHGSVYHRFQFDSQLFRMSSIAKTSSTGDSFHIFTKGSPEQMLTILKPETVPQNYSQILRKYTSKGFRVLSIASSEVAPGFKAMNRHQLELNLNFDGFLIFENRLKEETVGAINELRNADLPCAMITGDNPLTAASIAYECQISRSDKKTYICHYNQKTKKFALDLFEAQMGGEGKEITVSTIDEVAEKVESSKAQLCMTGHCLNQIEDPIMIRRLFINTTVFARAKPNDKVKIVSIFQSVFQRTVAMCGDGANDCGALKQADIGLSLSEAEASISAPFTSQRTNISSMVELLKECRAGLATNFSVFNIMALYSLIQYTTVVMVQFFFGFPGDFCYLYWDVCCNFIFLIFLGYTGTTSKLTKEPPQISLFTISNITQLMAAFLLQLIAQFAMLLFLGLVFNHKVGYTFHSTQDQFIENGDEFVEDSFEGNLLFLFSTNIYIASVIAFTISKPWRQEIFTNIPLLLCLILSLAYSSLMIVYPPARLSLLQIVHFEEQSFNFFMLYCSLGVSLVMVVVQKAVLEKYFNRREVRKREELMFLE